MKKTLIFAAAAILLAACAGEKDLIPEQINDEVKLVEYSFTVGIETKASIGDAGAFSWTAGDTFAVWDAQNNKFDEYTAQQDGATTTITGSGLANANYTKAYYPASVATAGENSIVWPASYESAAVAAKSFPMMALNDNGTLNFKHLGALLKVTINDLPAGVTSLVFNAGVGVSGTLAVDSTNPVEPFCALGSSASSITLPTYGVAGDAVFYLPLPVGTLTGGFSIDFKITSTNNKVVGTKKTTNNVSITRAKVIPMKAFTPTFNWPNDTDAFDYGVAKETTKKADYPESERLAYDPQIKNNVKLGTSSGIYQCTLDKITYYYVMTFNNNRWTTGQVNGPDTWMDLEGDAYDNIVPQNRCFSWKVNRPGKLSYFCCTYNSKFLSRGIQYSLVLLKKVNGETTAEVLKTIKPATENIVFAYNNDTSSNVSGWANNYDDPDYMIEFEVTAEDLLGIDEAATLFFYHKTVNTGGATIYHLPIKWTPSVD